LDEPDRSGIVRRNASVSNADSMQRLAMTRLEQDPTDLDETDRSGIAPRNASGSNADPSLRPAMSRNDLARTVADKTDNSGVVRVKASVPNAGTLLRPAMTGYAKISGPEMTIGRAYLRLCIRFLTVELWSWVP
jgi:multidrug efflux pump subunit AcrA (membrane-fusion protein)